MPSNLKKLISERRAKTGESHQTALRHVRSQPSSYFEAGMTIHGRRYYLHGDIAEPTDDNESAAKVCAEHQGKTVAYCKRCDSFEPVEHFDESRPEVQAQHRSAGKQMTGAERFAWDRKRYAKARAEWRARWVRPVDARNLFEV